MIQPNPCPRNRRSFLSLCAMGVVAWRLSATDRLEASAGTATRFALSDGEWRHRLSPQAYAVLRRAGTEVPWSSPLNSEHRRGRFLCGGCALPLYSSATKFDSGTGWPSFYDHLRRAITTHDDGSLGFQRTEVRCARCDSHLGHVFSDGPRPTGLRYCMNGVAMRFENA